MANSNLIGNPLDDNRLTLSGTTDAGQQQYRIWHDSQQVLVPKGQSTTKPLNSENVQVNTTAQGFIGQGYFSKLMVEFRNTIDAKLFDRFYLKSSRFAMPMDPIIDWLDDLDVNTIVVRYTIVFTSNENEFSVNFTGYTELQYHETTPSNAKIYLSPVLSFGNLSDELQGYFRLVTNMNSVFETHTKVLPTGQFLQPVNLPVSILVYKAFIQNGTSIMEIERFNDLFDIELSSSHFTVLEGN